MIAATPYDRDIAEAEQRLRPFIRSRRRRHGVAVVLALASWADAGDEWAAAELEQYATREALTVAAIKLCLESFQTREPRGAEGAMALLRCRSRHPAVNEMLSEMLR